MSDTAADLRKLIAGDLRVDALAARVRGELGEAALNRAVSEAIASSAQPTQRTATFELLLEESLAEHDRKNK